MAGDDPYEGCSFDEELLMSSQELVQEMDGGPAQPSATVPRDEVRRTSSCTAGSSSAGIAPQEGAVLQEDNAALPPHDQGEVALQGHSQHDDSDEAQELPEQVSVFSRKGRPNRLLQEAMRTALQAAGLGEEGGESKRRAMSAQANVLAHLADGDGPAKKARRQELVRQARVDSTDQVIVLRQSPRAFCALPPLATAVMATSRLGALEGDTVKDEIFAACCKMLGGAPTNLASREVRARLLGISERQLRVAAPLVGAGIFLLDRLYRSELERFVTQQSPAQGLIAYVDFVAYDETPLPVRLRGEASEPSDDRALSAPEAPHLQPQSSSLCSLSAGTALAKRISTTAIAQKILQTIQNGGFVCKVAGEYVTVLSATICPLQVVDRGTGALLYEAQRLIAGVSPFASAFSHQSRLVCTDRNAANMAGERYLMHERGVPWKRLHTLCEIHMTATAHEKTFALLSENIQGMIRCALALRMGSAMTRFRKCLRAEVASRFEVRYGSPPLEAMRYKQHVLRLFVSHGPQLAMRRILLALCPNGDWRSEKVECYVTVGCRHSERQLLDHVASGLVAALCASQPSTYPRHRWTGADLATDCLGVMEACHKLLSTTFLRFAAEHESGLRAQLLLSAGEGLATEAHNQPPLLALPSWQPGGDDETVGGIGAAEGMANTDAAASTADGQEASAAQINTVHRRMAATWLESRPLGRLMLQRIIMEPLRQLQRRQFELAGDDWEQKQRLRALSAQNAGTSSLQARDYRVCVAASGRDEAAFFSQLRLLLREADLWSILPLSCFTVAFRALAFRLISRAGCAIHELLAVPHQRFPFKVFRLLQEPELAPELSGAPACTLDEWSLDLRAAYPSLSGQDFMKHLELVCMMAWKDVSQVEARHATVRRLLMTASLQTMPQEFRDLSAEWCMLQARKRSQRGVGLVPVCSRKACLGFQTPWPMLVMTLVHSDLPSMFVFRTRCPCGKRASNQCHCIGHAGVEAKLPGEEEHREASGATRVRWALAGVRPFGVPRSPRYARPEVALQEVQGCGGSRRRAARTT